METTSLTPEETKRAVSLIRFGYAKDMVEATAKVLAERAKREAIAAKKTAKDTKEATKAQRERQKTRHNGKYIRMNVCDLCGVSCGADFFSTRRDGVSYGCVCAKCAE